MIIHFSAASNGSCAFDPTAFPPSPGQTEGRLEAGRHADGWLGGRRSRRLPREELAERVRSQHPDGKTMVFRGSKSSRVIRTGSVFTFTEGKMLNFGHQRRRKKPSWKHGCVCTFSKCVLWSVRVPPALTGQHAIWPPEPLSGGRTRDENDRHVTLHGANWQEEGSACKGSRWQVWHRASPGAK